MAHSSHAQTHEQKPSSANELLSNRLPMRPFGIQAKPDATEESAQTQGPVGRSFGFDILTMPLTVQPKLTIGESNDKSAQGSDRVASLRENHIATEAVQRLNQPQPTMAASNLNSGPSHTVQRDNRIDAMETDYSGVRGHTGGSSAGWPTYPGHTGVTQETHSSDTDSTGTLQRATPEETLPDEPASKQTVNNATELKAVVQNIKARKSWTGGNYSGAWQCNDIANEVVKVVADCTLKSISPHVLVKGGPVEPGGDKHGNTYGNQGNFWYFPEYHAVVNHAKLGEYDPTFERMVGSDIMCGEEKEIEIEGVGDVDYILFEATKQCACYGPNFEVYLYGSEDEMVGALSDKTTDVHKFWLSEE